MAMKLNTQSKHNEYTLQKVELYMNLNHVYFQFHTKSDRALFS